MNWMLGSRFRVGAWLVALALLCGGLLMVGGNIRAQDAPGNAGADAQPINDAVGDAEDGQDDSSSGWMKSLGGMIIKSGWIGIPFYIFLGVLSVAAMTVTLERFVHLRAMHIIPMRFVQGLADLLAREEDNPEVYRELCDSTPSTISRILRAGLIRGGRSLMEVEKAMEDSAAQEMSTMRGRHRLLSVVGSVAPLVGLLGTVVGMIFAFYQSSQAGLGKAEVLAEYIYLALITTALGLTVAIPSLLLVAWFNARVESFMRGIDLVLTDTIPAFVRMEKIEKRAEAEADRRDAMLSGADES